MPILCLQCLSFAKLFLPSMLKIANQPQPSGCFENTVEIEVFNARIGEEYCEAVNQREIQTRSL